MITDYKEIKESVLGCYEKMIETAHQIGFSTEDTSYISAKNQAEKIVERKNRNGFSQRVVYVKSHPDYLHGTR